MRRASWVDPDGVDPITPVMPMAGLRNTLSVPSPVVGLVRAGDAYSHTDPTLAHGLSFAIVQAVALGRVLADHADLADAADAYAGQTLPELRERYAWITDLDDQRLRAWQGEPLPLGSHDGSAYALFCMAAAGAVARTDPDVFRVFNRRIGLLDRTAVLDDDLAMRDRIERGFADLQKPSQGPSQEEMLAVLHSGQ